MPSQPGAEQPRQYQYTAVLGSQSRVAHPLEWLWDKTCTPYGRMPVAGGEDPLPGLRNAEEHLFGQRGGAWASCIELAAMSRHAIGPPHSLDSSTTPHYRWLYASRRCPGLPVSGCYHPQESVRSRGFLKRRKTREAYTVARRGPGFEENEPQMIDVGNPSALSRG